MGEGHGESPAIPLGDGAADVRAHHRIVDEVRRGVPWVFAIEMVGGCGIMACNASMRYEHITMADGPEQARIDLLTACKRPLCAARCKGDQSNCSRASTSVQTFERNTAARLLRQRVVPETQAQIEWGACMRIANAVRRSAHTTMVTPCQHVATCSLLLAAPLVYAPECSACTRACLFLANTPQPRPETAPGMVLAYVIG